MEFLIAGCFIFPLSALWINPRKMTTMKMKSIFSESIRNPEQGDLKSDAEEKA